MFYFRQTHPAFPSKQILLCEDVLQQQLKILDRLSKILPGDNTVEVLTVPGTIAAANLILNEKIDLIILDHDMSRGNGSDLLQWMQKEGKKIPIITASGIPQNNTHMMSLGANHCFTKQQVIDGAADKVIKEILGL